MKINKVEIKNFYSVKNIVLNFDKFKGVILVEGKNKDTGGSNGSGKSVLIEAVVWGIFGRTIRKSTEEALVNSQNKRECVVRITVNNDMVIERGKKPTHLRFIVGGEDRSQANALETQKLIDETLDKRTIIKNFLNLDDLFALRESVKYLKSQYSQTIKKQNAIVAEHEISIASFDKKLKDLSKLREEVEGKYDEAALSMSLQEVISLETSNKSNRDNIAAAKKKIHNSTVDVETLRIKLKNPKKLDYCTECGQPVEKRASPEQLERDLDYAKQIVAEQEEEITSSEAQITPLPISSSEYHKVIDYNQLKKESDTFEGLREETKEKIQRAHDIKQDYNNKYEIMRFWEKAFSEAGLVKYIIRNILNYLNGKVNFYLSHLSKGKFFIEFNEELKETITHAGREVHYISLSGGEKRKIDLAVLLGLQKLLALSSKDESNLMFFDEIAENLDQDGLDGLYILLSELKKEKTLFVITHNNYLKSLMDNVKTLTITKSKGTSTLGK